MWSYWSLVTSLVLLENGYLASGSEYETIKVWDTINGNLKYTFNNHSNTIIGLLALENGYLASCSADKTIQIRDITNGRIKYTFDKSTGGHVDWGLALASLGNQWILVLKFGT